MMPRTDSRLSSITPPSAYFSGNMSPLKPSRMPTTSQPRLRAASVAARITAFSPGASPPPVLRATREIGVLTPRTLGGHGRVRLQPFDDHRVGQPAGLAHHLKSEPGVALLQRAEE